jgi:ribosome-binding factor A
MSLKKERMNDRIRMVLSELLLREIADPRLQGVTITEVQLDGEMMYATVYVNALGDETRQADVMAGLKRAKGFLRREVGQNIRTRNTPELVFKWDTTLEHGEHINQLIDKLEIPPELDEDE